VTTKQYNSFSEFYPFYLSQHSDINCRRLHFIGSALVVGVLIAAVAMQRWWWLLGLPVIGYGFAWAGHFVFEKNRPATFQYPMYSFMGDWVMFKDMLTGKIRV